jgi:hypothetical protein
LIAHGIEALEINHHRAGLAAAKARGKVHGNAALAKANRDAAAERAEPLHPVFAELAGMSTRAAAAELDRRGIATNRGTTGMISC